MSDNIDYETVDEEITKKCTGPCDRILSLDHYIKSKKGKYGRQSYCKDCRNQFRRQKKHSKKTEGAKFCPRCEKDLSVNNFHKDTQNIEGLQTYCKTCKEKIAIKSGSTFEGFLSNLFKDLKHNAKKRNIQVEITKQDIIELYKQNNKCILTGIELTYSAEQSTDEHIANKYNISVDRIDSNKNYTKDNIRLVCAIINRIKTDMTDTEFIFWCKDIVRNNK